MYADSVKVPLELMGRGDVGDRHLVAALIALPHFGMSPGVMVNIVKPRKGHVRVRKLPPPGQSLGRDTELYPVGHRLAGQKRHEWHDRGDGVLVGYLKPDAPDLEIRPDGTIAGIPAPDPAILAEAVRRAVAEDQSKRWLLERIA